MKRNILTIITAFFLYCSGFSQEKLSVQNSIKDNTITSFNSQNLLLLDFWATWCAPCLPATEQLEVYQQQLKDKIYMIAISYEQEIKIRTFLDKHDIKLAVYQDFNNYNVDRFNVQYWPYSVILNNQGDIVWTGSPGNLSVDKIKALHRKQKQIIYKLNDIFEFKSNEEPELNYQTSKDTLKIFSKINNENPIHKEYYKTEKRVYYSGNIISLVSHLYDVPEININSEINEFIEFSSELDIWENEKKQIAKHLRKKHSIQVKETSELQDAFILKINDEDLLWDSSQIDWGSQNQSKFIIGNDRVEADNMTLNEIAQLLTKIKGVNYVYEGNDTNLYDWDFHYKFENLMRGELLDQFGININEQIQKEVKTLTIKKGNSK